MNNDDLALRKTDLVYRWWPRYSPGTVELGGAGVRPLLRLAAGLAVIAGVLATPPLVALTGLSAMAAVTLMAAYIACMVVNDVVLHPLAQRNPAGFNLQVAVTPLYNVAFCAAFVVIPGDPKSPLWMALLMYACVTGSWQEIDRSWALLILHVAAPLATIPLFLAHDAPTGWSVAAPVLSAVTSGCAYHLFSMLNGTWRGIRRQQAATIESLRARAAELERRELARDLHDSVGSALSVLALYGDLVEKHIDRPDELRSISSTLREAARDGLGELRGVLDAMVPGDATLAGLGEDLIRIGRRTTDATTTKLVLVTEGGADTSIAGRPRLAIVRVFQEAMNNALRHGRSQRINARLTADVAHVALEVRDDGVGFDPGSARDGGRGVPGMRARAGELGGTFVLESAPDAGTRVTLTLPLGPTSALA